MVVSGSRYIDSNLWWNVLFMPNFNRCHLRSDHTTLRDKKSSFRSSFRHSKSRNSRFLSCQLRVLPTRAVIAKSSPGRRAVAPQPGCWSRYESFPSVVLVPFSEAVSPWRDCECL